MAAVRPAPQPSPVWDTRLAQWGLVLLLVIVLGAVLLHQVREVQGQAELAQIKSTLGALRTAMVVAHLERTVAGSRNGGRAVAPVQRNPFTVLQQLPAHYAGLADPQALTALPGGSWVFDPDCACIGYRPMEAGRLEAPQDAVALWFRVGAPSSPLLITPQQPYVWMGQPVD